MVARGEPEARSFHVKRLVQADGGWTLRSDNTDVAPLALDPADTVVAAVRRVVCADEVDATTHDT